MATAGEDIADRPGDGEHFPALPCGASCRDQRAALTRGLDDQGTEGESTDDPVALREELAPRGCAGRQLGQQRTLAADSLRQAPMLGRIDAIEPVGAYRDREPAARERSLVTRRVDAGR